MTTPRSRPEPDRPDPSRSPDAPQREHREYPHGSGDRNSYAPFGEDREPRHEGGSQRRAPPAPGADGDAPPV